MADDSATIVAAPGRYGPQTVPKPSSAQPIKHVTVTSASGLSAVFGATAISQPGITFDHVAFNGTLRLRVGPTTVNAVHITGNGILVRGNNITITDSLIDGGFGHDGINIAGYPAAVHGITITGNTVRDIGQYTKAHPEHPDCIQIFDANHLDIERNNLYNCHNSGITFSHGANKGVSDVAIRANFVQGCLSARQSCAGGASLDLRLTVHSVTVTNNTFGTGSVRLPYQPGVTATRNVIGYLSVASPCTTSASDSIIGSYPAFACKRGTPGATSTTSSGNAQETVEYVDANDGDLRVRNAAAVTLRSSAASSTTGSAGTDIDGNPLAPGTVGADQPLGAETPGATGSVTSSPAPTHPRSSSGMPAAHLTRATGLRSDGSASRYTLIAVVMLALVLLSIALWRLRGRQRNSHA